MLSWWFIGLLGCSWMSIICGQDNSLDPLDIEYEDGNARMDLSGNDDSMQRTNDTSNILPGTTIMLTTTQTSEPLSCHECTNCNSKSDFIPRVCQAGTTMCYIMQVRIRNTSRTTRRGCSSSKTQCAGPEEEQTTAIESITCCTNHQCNQATHFRPLFFLWTFNLFTLLINIS